jgi:hypothetical protein
MLPRRTVLAAPCAAALVACPAGWAQEAGRKYRLGFVVPSPRSEDFWTVLFEELRRAGFVDGGNLQVVGEFGVAPDRADAVAAAAVKARPDAIFTAGPVWTRAVQRATKTIPINAYSAMLNNTANNVANLNTGGYASLETTMQEAASGGVTAVTRRNSTVDSVDLSTEAVDLSIAKNGVDANISVLKRMDEMQKSIIDMMV